MYMTMKISQVLFVLYLMLKVSNECVNISLGDLYTHTDRWITKWIIRRTDKNVNVNLEMQCKSLWIKASAK